MFIQTEKTPNPATLKFLPGRELAPGSPLDCPDAAAAARLSPLAERLFSLEGVERVMIGTDFAAVTRTAAAAWDGLKLRVMAALSDHLVRGLPIVAPGAVPAADAADEDETAARIRALIEERVRPVVTRDGGDIVFDRFEDGVVYLHMRGACAGCPSAAMTLKDGVEALLKTYVPEVREVRQAS